MLAARLRTSARRACCAAYSAMWMPPSWWATIRSTKSWSAAGPVAATSCARSSAVAIPGIRSTGTGWFIHAIAWPVSLAGDWPISMSSPAM